VSSISRHSVLPSSELHIKSIALNIRGISLQRIAAYIIKLKSRQGGKFPLPLNQCYTPVWTAAVWTNLVGSPMSAIKAITRKRTTAESAPKILTWIASVAITVLIPAAVG
jgi:hypothetical protein